MSQAQFFSPSQTMPISLAARAGDFVMTATLGPHFFRAEDVTYDDDGRVVGDGSGKGDLPIEEQTRATLGYGLVTLPRPPGWISKCRCGTDALPVWPTAPMTAPALTAPELGPCLLRCAP